MNKNCCFVFLHLLIRIPTGQPFALLSSIPSCEMIKGFKRHLTGLLSNLWHYLNNT